MWTSTRFDMTERNWIPNNFVHTLPNKFSQKTEHQDMFDLKIQRWRLMRERKLAKDELRKLETGNEVVYINDEEKNHNKANKIKKTERRKCQTNQ